MGPNNFAVSGSMDGCWVSTGPNNFAAPGSVDDGLDSMGPKSFAESVSGIDGSDSVGPNSFGDLEGVEAFLDKGGGVIFLRTDARTKEWGIGSREVNRSSGMEIVSPISISLGSSSGFALAMAFQFFTVPVYHFAI